MGSGSFPGLPGPLIPAKVVNGFFHGPDIGRRRYGSIQLFSIRRLSSLSSSIPMIAIGIMARRRVGFDFFVDN